MLSTLLYLCVVALSLGQFSILAKTQSGGFYLFDILIAIFVFLGIVTLFNREFKFPKNSLFFYAFTFLALIDLVPSFLKLSFGDFLVSFSYLLRWFLYLTSSVVIFNMLKRKIITENTLIKLFMYSALFISIAGFIQLLVLPDFTVLDPSLGWDPHKNRLASTFFDPNFTGVYLVLCVALTLYFHHTLNKLNITQKTIFLLVPIIALILTFSRSSWAALSLVVLIHGLFKNRKLLLIFALLTFLVYFAVPRVQTRLSGITDPADSAHFRIISWSNTWQIAKDNLFLGTGYNTFRFAQKEYGFIDAGESGGNSGAGSDSSFLLILATTGVLGSALFVIAFFSPLFTKLSMDLKILFLSTTIPLFVHSQFVNSIFYPQILFLWLVIFSVINYSSDRL